MDDLGLARRREGRTGLSRNRLSRIGTESKEISSLAGQMDNQGELALIKQAYIGVISGHAVRAVTELNKLASESFADLMEHHVDLCRRYKEDPEKYKLMIDMLGDLLDDAARNHRTIVEDASAGLAAVVSEFSRFTPEQKKSFLQWLVS